MPDKHIKFSESLLGLGSFALESLVEPKTIDDLWAEFSRARDRGEFPSPHSFENLVLAVDALFAIKAVEQVEQSGLLRLCD